MKKIGFRSNQFADSSKVRSRVIRVIEAEFNKYINGKING